MRNLLGFLNRLKKLGGILFLLHRERQPTMDEALTQEYVDGGGEIEPEIRICADTVAIGSPPFYIRYTYYIVFAIQRKQLFKKCYP